MNKMRFTIALLAMMITLAVTGQLLAANGAIRPQMLARHADPDAKSTAVLPSSQAHGDTIQAPAVGQDPARDAVTCKQIVVNPQLDVVELGPGTGTAEPWIFLDPIVYYVKEGDGSGNAFAGYSLVLPDGDAGDPTPKSDILSQVVQFVNGLESATVSYQRAMLDANPQDSAYGELWQLTAEGDVDLGNPGQYRLARWQITDSENNWAREEIEVDQAVLPELSGQEIALLLRTETNGGGASEAEKEWLLLDDVTITACGRLGDVYLPIIKRQ